MQLTQKELQLISEYFSTQPVLKAFLFGSYSRNQANESSDVDILVDLDYSQHIGFGFVSIKEGLEEKLHRNVDLVSSKAVSKHILEAISEIELYTKEAGLAEFLSNSMMRFASIKQIEIIGEAANYITAETKEKFNSIEWNQITGMRHILVHEYFGVDADLIWQVISRTSLT